MALSPQLLLCMQKPRFCPSPTLAWLLLQLHEHVCHSTLLTRLQPRSVDLVGKQYCELTGTFSQATGPEKEDCSKHPPFKGNGGYHPLARTKFSRAQLKINMTDKLFLGQ